MRKLTTNIDARSLLNSLAEAGHLDAAASAEAEGYVTEQTKDRELPLHLRVLAGFGAFIAALCFFGFLMAAHVIRFKDGAGMMAWGVAFIVIAIVVALPLRAKCNTVGQNFALMLSLANMGVGKLMFVAGFAELYGTRNDWGVVIGILMVTVGTYFFYRLSIDRFLGVLALLVAIVMTLTGMRHALADHVLTMNALFVAQLGLTGLLLLDGKLKREHMVIAYAAAFGLCFTVIHLLAIKHGYWPDWKVFDLRFINIALAVALIGLIAWSAGDVERLKSEPVIVAAVGAAALGFLSAPGITLALCLMVLGYAKHELILTALGILLMPVAIFHYYYALDLTLLMKSGILVASGVVMLAGRAYLAFRQLDGQVQS